jgi:hypothetical protein
MFQVCGDRTNENHPQIRYVRQLVRNKASRRIAVQYVAGIAILAK